MKSRAQSVLPSIIIVVIITILTIAGVLWYVIANRPEGCDFGLQFDCEDFRVDAESDSILLRIKNSANDPKYVLLVEANNTEYGILCRDDRSKRIQANFPGTFITRNNEEHFTLVCNKDLVPEVNEGEPFTFNLKLYHYSSSSRWLFNETEKGKLFAKIEP